jgi:cell division transport system permease protein
MAKSADASAPRWRPAPLLPHQRAEDMLLVFVNAVLCFFACLSVIAALGADRAARGWAGQLTGSATVLVRPSGDETPDSAAERAAEALSSRSIKGVGEARVIEKEKAEALVEPWLGPGAKLADLPLPRLVTVDLDPKAPATAEDLERALKAAGVDATVDDHSRWIKDIVGSGRLVRLAAAGAAALIALAAAAVIAFATHAGLASRAEIVEVLHLSGAEDGFIIGLFQNRLAELAGLGGLIGALAAMGVAALARVAGGAGGLTPALPVEWTDLLAVLPCPLIAAAVAALAARFTAQRQVGSLN